MHCYSVYLVVFCIAQYGRLSIRTGFSLVRIHYFYPFYLIMQVCVYFYNSSCYV
ncbi:hypothetical protein HMPREF3190_01470 [Umbribacter vaginalis]|nr:hypothetical protein HMPREF3190_01470 [Coriobacteriales bacterium DNF00809]